ncbi:MAG: hypothetical protein OXQ28_13500 [Acidobacteriota bacterium]|nr:hypothetical protein [Acidobacteriota bacterium]
MSQENGSGIGEDMAERIVSVAYPLTFEEFQRYYEQGYQVATTAEQRVEWGLEAHENLSVLSHEQALRVLFAEPGDPILDEVDEECYPDENWVLGEENAPNPEAIARMAAERERSLERRLDTVVTVRDPRRPQPAGSGADGGESREVAAASA